MDEQLPVLFQRYFEGTASESDRKALMELVMVTDDISLEKVMRERWLALEQPDEGVSSTQGEHILATILHTPARRIQLRTWWAAAAIALLLCVGGYMLFKPATHPVTTAQEITPGSNKAVLVLADGSTVTLDSAGRQTLQQGATTIRQEGGRLMYDNKGTTLAYNTLNTPRGGQFQVTLPDGTKVWLNAASSLKYPTAFTGKDRLVEVTGEAYFEVTKDAARPFKVKFSQQDTVQVLGTSFNVQAYADEPTAYTTLIEGSVRIGKTVLTPGNQAAMQGSALRMKQADVEAVMAWKNGYFIFRDENIRNIMREVARWYDIEVIHSTDLPYRFNATISRDTPLAELLEILSLTNKVKFTTTGRKVTVQP